MLLGGAAVYDLLSIVVVALVPGPRFFYPRYCSIFSPRQWKERGTWAYSTPYTLKLKMGHGP